MALTRYHSTNPEAAISKIEFYNNSFGREDALIYPGKHATAEELSGLAETLKKQKITAYADIRDGQPVLVAYGFKKPEKLLSSLRKQGLTTGLSKPEAETSAEEKALEGSPFKKFVKRNAIKLAAVSGLMGHASMAAISAATQNPGWFGTAWKYTLSDAVISRYGTDKNVTADPVMQDFKDYLWKQDIDNSFVKARTDKVSALEGFDSFMQKYSFQIANGFGMLGNINQIGIGQSENNSGLVIAGATSAFGASLQILGSEEKRNPEQLQRRGVLAKVLNFLDANPMQVAAITNFTDPIALFFGAWNSEKIDQYSADLNASKMLQHSTAYAEAHLQVQGRYDVNVGQANLDLLGKVNEKAGELAYEQSRRGDIVKQLNPFVQSYSPENAQKLAAELSPLNSQLQRTGLMGENNTIDLTKMGIHEPKSKTVGEFLKGLFSKEGGGEKAPEQVMADSKAEIEGIEESNRQLNRGQGIKRPLLFAVATFYTGATLLRLIAKKTASADENRDAFNEVYAAAAESLLNIKDGQQRDDMMMQMGHYLSTHPKMKQPSTVILEKLRERVETFENNPFVKTVDTNVEELPAAVAANDAEKTAPQATIPAAEPAPEKAGETQAVETAGEWMARANAAVAASHQATLEANRQKLAENNAAMTQSV